MLLVKLGVFAIFGKQFYLPFVYAHLIQHSSQAIKNKLNEKFGG